jgi:polyribonucleotide nucleotidyltransferase
MNNIKKYSVEIGGKTLNFEHGKMAKLATGSVFATYGDTSILVTVEMGEAREGIDFFPLVVDFEAKYYAIGKIKGSRFNKREGRASDSAILTARMIDRPLRPLFPKGMTNEVQIICTLLQSNGEQSAAPLAINAASMGLLISGIPFEKPVGAVRIGMNEAGKLIVDPTYDQCENGSLDLLVAGSEDSIMMVEAGANLISNEKMLEALAFAHEEIKKICQAQLEFIKEFDIEPKIATLKEESAIAEELVNKILTDAEFDAVKAVGKMEIKKQLHVLENKLMDACAEQLEAEEVSKQDLKKYFDKKFGASIRRRIFEKGTRIDGRKTDEIRPIYVETNVLPRLHGSAIFQRGETQALSILTVGGPNDEMLIDDPDRPEHTDRYIHHYNFPPYSVGEVGRLRGPGRREIGHGKLAERALQYVIPTGADNPYTLRVVSEILSCNGSSSMASVCGSTLALMSGGIKIKAPIAGIAMGLVMDEETGVSHILTDIQGLEDAGGDMDFKVTGDENGITALQMDIKVKGLKLELLKDALEAAQKGRTFILSKMKEVIAKPATEMSKFAPRIDSFYVDIDDISAIIGKGGEVIQGLEKDFNVDIKIEEDGQVIITSTNQKNAKEVRMIIDRITYKPQIGDIIEQGVVKSIKDFGAFIEIAPGQEALLHISEIADERVEKVEDFLKVGDIIKVKIIEKDNQGRLKISKKQA